MPDKFPPRGPRRHSKSKSLPMSDEEREKFLLNAGLKNLGDPTPPPPSPRKRRAPSTNSEAIKRRILGY